MSTDFMTYEDIRHNWGLYEQYLVETHYGTRKERTYDHVIGRVSTWLGSRKVLNNTPSTISSSYTEYKTNIQEFLTRKFIVPSSPILKYGGTRKKNPNYFSYYLFGENFPLNPAHQVYAGPGVELGYQYSISYQPNVERTTTEINNPYIGVGVREDGGTVSELIRAKGNTHKNVIYYHEVDLQSLGVEMGRKNRYGITLGQNIKRKGIIPDVLKGYYGTSSPGYIGPVGTSCPMFYINLSGILGESKDYSSYLTKVYSSAFYAAILSNVILYQNDGYIAEEFVENTLKYRPIGVGMLGLHSAMLRCDLDYESSDGLLFAEQSQAASCLGSVSGSCRLMAGGSKHDRVGCKSERLTKMIRECANLLEEDEVILPFSEYIGQALESHGCMFNIVTSVQGSDPNLEGLLHLSSHGIAPIFSIENHVELSDERNLTVFPLELFDTQGNMTYDLPRLQEQTSPYITPEYTIKLITTLQNLCHSAISINLDFPSDIPVTKMINLLHGMVQDGVFHISAKKGDIYLHERVENTNTPVNEVEDPQVEEIQLVEDNSDKNDEELPSPFEVDHVVDEKIPNEPREMKPRYQTFVTEHGDKIRFVVTKNDILVDAPMCSSEIRSLLTTLCRLLEVMRHRWNSDQSDWVMMNILTTAFPGNILTNEETNVVYHSIPEVLERLMFEAGKMTE